MHVTNALVLILVILLVIRVKASLLITLLLLKVIYVILVDLAIVVLIAKAVFRAIMEILLLKEDFAQYVLVIHLEVFMGYVIMLQGNVIAVMVLVEEIVHLVDQDMPLLMGFVLRVIKVRFFYKNLL